VADGRLLEPATADGRLLEPATAGEVAYLDTEGGAGKRVELFDVQIQRDEGAAPVAMQTLQQTRIERQAAPSDLAQQQQAALQQPQAAMADPAQQQQQPTAFVAALRGALGLGQSRTSADWDWDDPRRRAFGFDDEARHAHDELMMSP